MHEGNAQSPSRNADSDGPVGVESELLLRSRRHQIFQLACDGRHLAGRTIRENRSCRFLHRQVFRKQQAARRCQQSLQESKIHRLGHVGAEQVILRVVTVVVTVRTSPCCAADGLNDVRQVVLALSVVIGQPQRIPVQGRRPDGIKRTVSFRQLQQPLARRPVCFLGDVSLLNDPQHAAALAAHDAAFASILRRLVLRRQKRNVSLPLP